LVKHRRPLAGLLGVLLACLILGVLGLGVEEKLQPLSLEVPGTSASDGEMLAQSHFGDSSPFIVLLRGLIDKGRRWSGACAPSAARR
jgi:hypothetical protein